MAWTVRDARKYGYEEGMFAFDNSKDDPDVRKYWERDDLGEVVGQILEGYRQFADTIYYQTRSEKVLDAFEEGFYKGYYDAASEYFGGK